MNLSNKKLLIFDYDGTIADTSKLHEKAFHKVLDPYNIKFDYSSISGLKSQDAIRYCLKQNNRKLKKQKIIDLVKNKQDFYKTDIQYNINLMPGAYEFITWAHSKFYLSIASSGSKENILKGIKLLKLSKYFNEIICSEDVKKSKPAPEIFNRVISITKFSTNEALIFEDADNGIKAANKAKIDCIDIRKYSFKYLLNKFKKNDYQ